jgi:chemotaxis protein CheD
MAKHETALPEVYVQPGESHLVSASVIMRTVLGSCVGITYWVPRLGIAALCHPMMPNYPAKPPSDSSLIAGCRYVDYSICDMARQLDARGARRGEVQVKLFGGGDVLLVTNQASRPTVGKLNCEAALRVLGDEGFSVIASSLGGTSGLKIQFHTETGEVLLWRLGSTGVRAAEVANEDSATAVVTRRERIGGVCG